MVFVNREVELRQLEELLQAGTGQLMLLYGRRRLGKTALLRELHARHGGLYFQVPDQAETGILQHLNARLREQTGRPVHYAAIADFLGDLGGHGHRLVVLDEVQRLFEAVPGSDSLLQEAWDATLKEQGLAVILCGSVIGTLEALTEAKSPVYGRFTYAAHLEPFKYAAVRQFYPGLDESAILERYAVFGATPHYHDINLGRELRDALRQSFLTSGAPLRDEPRTLFSIEFQRPERYQEILEAMGQGAQSLGEVAQRYGRKAADYTAYFQALQDRLRIVGGADPVAGKRRRKRIAFTDPFFRFYYGKIYPNIDRIELGDADGVLDDIEQALPSLVGRAWEDVCRQWMVRMQGKTPRGVSIRFRALGSWWEGEDEIDVVALGNDDVYAGECKYRRQPVPKADVENLVQRAERVKEAAGTRRLHLFIWTKSRLRPAAQAYADEQGIHVMGVDDVVADLVD